MASGGVVDAGLFVVLPIEQLGGIAFLGGPMQIHPQHHLGPVVGVGAAVAGVDRENGSLGVERAVEQAFQLKLGNQAFDADRVRAAIRRQTTHLLRPCRSSLGCRRRPRSASSSGLSSDSNFFQLGDRGLGLFLIVPERGAGHLFFDGG